MAWGSLFDKRLEYAVGTFDASGTRYQPFNNRQDVMAFLNFKPFYTGRKASCSGTSSSAARSTPGTRTSRSCRPCSGPTRSPSAAGITSTAAANTANVAVPGVQPQRQGAGRREHVGVHLAYYYGGLTLLGAWDGGSESYALGTRPGAGSHPDRRLLRPGRLHPHRRDIRDRTLIDPLRPFDPPRPFGLGAIELTARFSKLHLDRRVFAAGLADPNLWTNRTQ